MMWGHAKPRVLVVEDDVNNHLLFATAYEQAGFETLLCQTAEGDFVSMVAEFAPDIIAMDLMIGQSGVEVKRDGFDAIQLLKSDERTQKIPIVVVSNFSGEDKIKFAQELGVVDFYNLQGQTVTKIAHRLKEYVTKPKAYKPSHPFFRNE